MWIITTILASIFQIIRTGLQKELRNHVDNYLATWARYIFIVPIAIILLIILSITNNSPNLNSYFFLSCFTAGTSQIIGTLFLLKLFSYRQFATSTAFIKTEGIQIAIIGVIFFDESLSLFGIIAVILSAISIYLMLPKEKTKKQIQIAMLGIGAGFFFAITAWFVKQSFIHLQINNKLLGTLIVLPVIVIMQSLLLFFILLYRKSNFSSLWQVKYRSILTSLSGMLASFFWFYSFIIVNPAYVKILAQIELPIAIIVGYYTFKEKISKKEILGIVITIISILFILKA